MSAREGEYLGFSCLTGLFHYRYTCSRCGVKFIESTPEVNEPVLCEACYHGLRRPDGGVMKAKEKYARKRGQASR